MYKQIERPNKESVINAFFSQVNAPVKVYLCLPSLECKDVVIGMQRGIIDKRTKIVAVERDYAIAHNMGVKLKSLGLKYEVHNCELERAEITDKIDLAYIDICGQITADILFWLTNLNFTENAKVGFTFSQPARSHGTFYKRLLKGRVLAEPYLTGGAGCAPNQIKIASAITFMLPGIRFNICKSYQDSRVPMLFLGGYYGKASYVKFKQPKAPEIPKIERRIVELAQGVNRPQQVGGFKIMWNRLTPGEKMGLRKKFKKEFALIGNL